MTRTSLFAISEDILALAAQRDAAEEEGDAAIVESADAALQKLLYEQLPAKVDSIRNYIRSQENAAEVHEAEAQQQTLMAKRARGNIERVKEYILAAMRHLGAAKLPGNLHCISRRRNGGILAMSEPNLDMLPRRLQRITVILTMDDYLKLVSAQIVQPLHTGIAEPSTAAIRSILEKQEAEQARVYAWADEQSLDHDAPAVIEKLNKIEAVPGVRLLPRGEHVRLS